MTGEALLTLMSLAAVLALSFILSGMESGVFSLNRLRIRQQRRAGKKSADVLHAYLENSEDFLWTILVGNTLANAMALSIMLVALFNRLRDTPAGFVAASLAIILVFYGLFELLPKTLFRLYPNRLCMAMARPFRFIRLILRPFVWIVGLFADALLAITGDKEYTGHLFGSRSELRQVMNESAEGLSSAERGMINKVMDMQIKTVRQASTPIGLARCLTLQSSMQEALELAREHKLTRFPVWNRSAEPRRIVGVLNLKRLLYEGAIDENKTVAHYVRSGIYLDENLPLDRAMRRMQDQGQRLAVVLDRNRREIGVISLQDILRAVFGKLSL